MQLQSLCERGDDFCIIFLRLFPRGKLSVIRKRKFDSRSLSLIFTGFLLMVLFALLSAGIRTDLIGGFFELQITFFGFSMTFQSESSAFAQCILGTIDTFQI